MFFQASFSRMEVMMEKPFPNRKNTDPALFVPIVIFFVFACALTNAEVAKHVAAISAAILKLFIIKFPCLAGLKMHFCTLLFILHLA